MKIFSKLAIILCFGIALTACAKTDSETKKESPKQSTSEITNEEIKNLPETSAIKQAVNMYKKQQDKLDVENEERRKSGERRKAAEEIGKKLKLLYDGSSFNGPTDYLGSGLLRLKEYDGDEEGVDKTVAVAYPECRDGRYIIPECVYTYFILDHLQDQELKHAFVLAQQAGVQIVLSCRIGSNPGSVAVYALKGRKQIWINVLASNEAIVSYLTKNANTK